MTKIWLKKDSHLIINKCWISSLYLDRHEKLLFSCKTPYERSSLIKLKHNFFDMINYRVVIIMIILVVILFLKPPGLRGLGEARSLVSSLQNSNKRFIKSGARPARSTWAWDPCRASLPHALPTMCVRRPSHLAQIFKWPSVLLVGGVCLQGQALSSYLPYSVDHLLTPRKKAETLAPGSQEDTELLKPINEIIQIVFELVRLFSRMFSGVSF